MTDRQKEMLKKRALAEFLTDYPGISMDDIEEFEMVYSCIGNSDIRLFYFSHYVFGVQIKGKIPIIYIPKERFRVKEDNNASENNNI